MIYYLFVKLLLLQYFVSYCFYKVYFSCDIDFTYFSLQFTLVFVFLKIPLVSDVRGVV